MQFLKQFAVCKRVFQFLGQQEFDIYCTILLQYAILRIALRGFYRILYGEYSSRKLE